MLFRMNLFVGALALIAASGSMAYDHGTKGTAMQNIEDRQIAPVVRDSDAPMVMGYSKPSMWVNHESDMRLRESSRSGENVNTVVTESGELRTQRANAADVSFSRDQGSESRGTEYRAVKRYDRGTKGTAMQNIENR